MEAGYKKLSVGMLVPLLWSSPPALVRNDVVALRRFLAIQKLMRADPEFAKAIAINKYLLKGYARKVPKRELGGFQYFQPHFAIVKPSASYKGIAMNDGLLSGPTFQTQLPQVLIRFRKGPFAITANVEAMFSKI